MRLQKLMRQSLIERLPEVLPLALHWAMEMQASCLEQGKPLAFWQLVDARNVGVAHPKRIRLCLVEAIPAPNHPALCAVAKEAGLLGSETVGLALGYALYLSKSHAGLRRILRHELRHVAQCEAMGGLGPFLAEYLGQVAENGYSEAPLEVDARSYELGHDKVR